MQFFASPLALLLVWYLVSCNALALLLYAADKSRAQRGLWRISEKMLLCIALVGGSVGALVGMRLFRHKTQHAKFRYGLPVILVLQTAAATVLILKPWSWR